MDREVAGPSKRLAVLKGHLQPSITYSCSASGGRSVDTDGGLQPGKKKASGSSAPMSSNKDEVQKAFPRSR